MSPAGIAALFLDLGGVLLTNGWDHHARASAASAFGLDAAEFDERHRQVFDAYEVGKISLATYLDLVVFDRPRPFTRAAFTAFMFAQSRPYPEMLDLIRALKTRHGIKVVAVSNEGRELAEHRIQAFCLADVVDVFVVSGFVHYRKPDPDLFQLALDVAQAPRDRVVYVEDRPVFVEAAERLGIRSLRHVSFEATRAALAALGLGLDAGT